MGSDGPPYFPTLREAFDHYTSIFKWVVRSVQILAERNAEGELKKMPNFGSSWKGQPSCFNAAWNSLMINTESSKLIVIDVDNKPGDSGLGPWSDIESACGGPFSTFTVASGTGGKHIYFKVDGFENSPLNKSAARCFYINGTPLNIDLRAKGGCIFAAPSSYADPSDGEKRFTYNVLDASEPMVLPHALASHLISLTRQQEKARHPGSFTMSAFAARRSISSPARTSDNTATLPADSEGDGEGAPDGGEQQPYDDTSIARAKCILKLFTTPNIPQHVHDATWSNHDAIIRIAFAANNVCQGKDTLLNDFIALVKSSNHAQNNHVEWASQLYNTPPPANQHRPGLCWLTTLEAAFCEKAGLGAPSFVALCEAHEDLNHSAEARITLANHLKGILESFTEYDFAKYIAEALHPVFRYGRDKTQKKGDHLYRFDGARYVLETGSHNFSTEAREALIAILNHVLDDPRCAHYQAAAKTRMRWIKGKEFKSVCAEAETLLMTDVFYLHRKLMKPVDFHNCLDSNPYLLGFTNGVFDLKTMTFYPPGSIPQGAYVSYSVNYDYIGDPHGKPVDEGQRKLVKKVYKEVYLKLFPRPEVRRCAKAMVGACLVGGSGVTKKLFLCIGPDGDNGKSLFAYLLEETLGDYFGTLSPRILTDAKQNPEACNPAIASARKRKLCVMNEGVRDAPLVGEVVKQLTGGDNIPCRDLYGAAFAAAFLCKLWYFANNPPIIKDEKDKPLLKRCWGLDFESKFEKDLEADLPAQKRFKGVPETDQRAYYKEVAPLHMLLCIQFAKDFIDSKYKLPPLPPTSEITANLLKDTPEQVVQRWLNDNYEATDGVFSDEKSEEEKQYHTVLNLQDVWNELKKEHKFSKEYFEEMLRASGIVIKSVNNKWVGSIKKAVLLRRL